jgi:hypothetical protein
VAGDRYCTRDDLLFGTTKVPEPFQDKHVNAAADEIDAALGEVYVLPLAPPDVVPAANTWQALPQHVKLYLKRCNVFIASGRLLMETSSRGQEGDDAYAMYLLREGQNLLAQMVNGQVDLGAVKVASMGDSGGGPSIQQYDTTSGVDHFYAFASGDPYVNYGLPPETWHPGP